ncbi:sphingosine N-acyltransferase lag1 [Linnemannia gamsii]|uniref:Sphingosine N-acyltransferase lag1 n=1 Tax=Linnemannia gamsii TaxID=64522 RepID=A0ABQ7JX54_9FUNG|nr:sphingosine N-acyltransferase lag1 [Linnemannia gamsii]
MNDCTANSSGLQLRMPLQQRNSSYRRKVSLDTKTGQPHHYDHRRHHLQDPTLGRPPSPPEGTPKFDDQALDDDPSQPLYRYNKDGFLVPIQRQNEQTWSSFLIQHQLVLSCSVILAVIASHVLIVSKEIRDGHNVDLVGSLTAMVPPPIWKSLPATWTRAGGGSPSMIKNWKPKLGAYNPNDAWSSQAMALQYQTVIFDEVTGQEQVVYGKGWNDLYMVMVWVMIWTAIREAVMTFLLIPLGRRLGVGEQKKKLQHEQQHSASVSSSVTPPLHSQEKGVAESILDAKRSLKLKLKKEEHAREGKLLRFAEQGWLVVYDGCMWTFGMCLLYNSSYWSDSTYFWRDYPKTHLDATMKWYYLVQFAFWVQQFLLAVLGIEKRRKDFLEFMIHHVITCLLIGFSYSFNLTSVGHAVLCSMDFSDIVLAACKMLKYCQKDQVADVGFVFFVVTWIYTRHIWFGQIIWSTYKEAPQFATMVWNPSNGLYFTPAVCKGFLLLLCGLYAVLVFWLAMIFKIVLKVLKGENSEDVRSEDEEEVEEEVIKEESKKAVEVDDVPRRSMQVLREQTVRQ